jgi:predicted transposase YdaD
MKKEYNSFQQLFVDDGIKIGQERGRQEGRQQGIEQGIEQGRKEGAVALLERQLVQRFGPLPQTAHKKLAKASLAQVETWSDALAAAQSLKQVFR